ncbi:hypothetical protein RA210_U260012 [Rubrivivax sp. A210]|nr:hypothetical protein RA210_U260012 [Rubrivivax sp. A210]
MGQGAARDHAIACDARGVSRQPPLDFLERFNEAFVYEMQAFVAACRGETPLTLELADATEATRIGLAITRSLRSGLPQEV